MRFAALLLGPFCLLALTIPALADAPLDLPYPPLTHPHVDPPAPGTLSRSDVISLIAQQTPVKHQGSRGTCSIFSSTALVENALIRHGAPRTTDYSEEWLQYLVSQTTPNSGSTSPKNFGLLKKFGHARERALPYDESLWSSAGDGEAARRCAHLEGRKLRSCLFGHRDPALMALDDSVLRNRRSGVYYDPEFADARAEAAAFRERELGGGAGTITVAKRTADIKALLRRGVPLAMEVPVYYGSWNHRFGADVGVPTDPALWAEGTVTYPEPGSLDAELSRTHPAGHSVLIVGYDDDRVVQFSAKMKDGSWKTFRRRGVYYFKNSWGTGSFGVNFTVEGRSYPGYGMITQDYAHRYGQFSSFEF